MQETGLKGRVLAAAEQRPQKPSPLPLLNVAFVDCAHEL